MARQPMQGSTEGGFTLIELLISLTILGVIMALLGGAVRTIARNSEVHIGRIETLDMISRAADILGRDASGFQRLIIAGNPARFVFLGHAERLSFITLEPPYPTSPGPYFVDYSVKNTGASAELVRSRAAYRKGMDGFPGATPASRVPMIEGGYRYRFAYAERKGQQRRWLSAWPFSHRLPDLIRLQVTDARSDALAFPAIVVAISADAELSCLVEDADLCSARSGGDLRSFSRPKQEPTFGGAADR